MGAPLTASYHAHFAHHPDPVEASRRQAPSRRVPRLPPRRRVPLCNADAVRANTWGLITAAIGAVIIVLLVIYGTEYGTYLDEVGPYLDETRGAAPTAPTIVLLAIIGLVAVGLLIGGLMNGLTASTTTDRTGDDRG